MVHAFPAHTAPFLRPPVLGGDDVVRRSRAVANSLRLVPLCNCHGATFQLWRAHESTGRFPTGLRVFCWWRSQWTQSGDLVSEKFTVWPVVGGESPTKPS